MLGKRRAGTPKECLAGFNGKVLRGGGSQTRTGQVEEVRAPALLEVCLYMHPARDGTV